MFKKYSPLVLTTLLGAGIFAMSGHSSSAASVPYVQQNATQALVDNPLLQEVRRDGRRGWSSRGGNGGWGNNHNNGGWGNNHHGGGWGNKHHGHNGHNNFDNWGYFAAPLIIGGALASGGYGYYGGGGGHVQYCLNRYNSYNPRYNTWVSYSGRVNQCRSPYRY